MSLYWFEECALVAVWPCFRYSSDTRYLEKETGVIPRMRKKTDRERRLNLFHMGNTKCPICLIPFSEAQVTSGKDVTLEHAPPKTLGGKIVCLTCADCNNKASRLDKLAMMDKKARDDHSSGRGTRVEMDFFGWGITSGYVRQKDDAAATKFAEQPVPTSINELPGGSTMRLPYLPISPDTDVTDTDVRKGIHFRIRTPNPHKVSVSWLRSAYLLLFALLGSEGYRYAKSGALGPIRKQILNPDKVTIKGCLSMSFSDLELPVDPLIMMNHGQEPAFWIVIMGDRCVSLPLGGPIERFRELTREPLKLSLSFDQLAYWASVRFVNHYATTIHFESEQDFRGVDFVGGLVDVKTADNTVWEWIVVDHQLDDVIILPFRRKGDEQPSGVQLITGDEAKYMNRTDRGSLQAAVPVAMRCIRVGDKVYPFLGRGA